MARLSLIRLDARGWQRREDFWAALLPALGAPDWHGPNLDALYDGLVAGENRVRPPLTVEIVVSTPFPVPLTTNLDRVRNVFADAARDTGLPIELRFV
ncbi:RNAse (barnase) inhibitor barstar [Sphingomonas endophytica]|uniref:RNAse (Barnase) inhibitor barstar n=1 Tax=Sphingomonas endophytica TaxID=869719 RepID=A0A7X0JB45_9SPHN|nr:barstar family protein [Sphingomonas endophytica]MBB6503337.1 RNAse (barnase) inhibitor barstar [Sphingomonas endophytica]